MIGVVARVAERDVAREFFELFKVPWEFWTPYGRYDVVIHADEAVGPPPAKLVMVYGALVTAFDETRRSGVGPPQDAATLGHDGARLPLYGRCVTFPSNGATAHRLVLESTGEPVAKVVAGRDGIVVRVGYDLFHEIGLLLTTGQPPARAGIPTLERHIDFMRDCIVGAGIPLVELPPVPHGYRFVTCLTHDVDHPSIRMHRFDHTMLGFLYRATVGSLVGVCTRGTRLQTVRRNLTAAAALPLVYLGWAKDFWSGFDQYLELEKGLGSTFFVIATKNRPGRTVDGVAPRLRGASYGVADIAPQLNVVRQAGGEIALHGIDAWLDSASGAEERAAVSRVSGAPALGTRMHWLYWGKDAPRQLEDAGFTYDSTFGYNETVGFRAGTLQAFKPISARELLELPLTVMDTALFYPSYLGLTPAAARDVVWGLVDEAERHGGALTINWHDRSLAPERLWGDFYRDLVEELKRRQAWFPTMVHAAAWFRCRRSAVFDSVRWDGDSVRVSASADVPDDLPALTLRVHTPGAPDNGERLKPLRSRRSVDVALRSAAVEVHAHDGRS